MLYEANVASRRNLQLLIPLAHAAVSRDKDQYEGIRARISKEGAMARIDSEYETLKRHTDAGSKLRNSLEESLTNAEIRRTFTHGPDGHHEENADILTLMSTASQFENKKGKRDVDAWADAVFDGTDDDLAKWERDVKAQLPKPADEFP
ncbi:MAG: hypothetical protein Q9166_007069 [cf. Caloplaca sp. 2 TL-2023]